MTEQDHTYTFAGFPGKYWDKKQKQQKPVCPDPETGELCDWCRKGQSS